MRIEIAYKDHYENSCCGKDVSIGSSKVDVMAVKGFDSRDHVEGSSIAIVNFK